MARQRAEFTGSQRVAVVERSSDHVLSLPVRFRWETTRRHPYYLALWENARRYRQGQFTERADEALCHAAAVMLGAIGVTGEPVAPDLEFENLGATCAPFLAGAVQPVTLRALATMLTWNLPPAELRVIAATFLSAVNPEYAIEGDDERQAGQRTAAIERLTQLASPSLDAIADAPIFHVHLASSQRTILDDLRQQMRYWQERRIEPPGRLRVANLAEYIEVLDLREGWTGAGYEVSQELPFGLVAQRCRQPQSTIFSRYRSAFELIVGHPFTPQLWWRIFGPLKFSRLFANPADSLTTLIRHRFQSPARREVPESIIWTPPRPHMATPTERGPDSICAEADGVDLVVDLTDLIAQGLDNEEIARRLDLNAEMVATFRDRSAELGDLSSE